MCIRDRAYVVTMMALARAGDNVLLPTPSWKLATNTPIYERMIDDMDINCGDVLDVVSLEQKGREIFDKLLKMASGERSKSEELGYGDAEYVPWQIGATM